MRDEPFSYSSSRNHSSYPITRDFRSINSFTMSSSRFPDKGRYSYHSIYEQPSTSLLPSSSAYHNGPVYENGVLISSSSSSNVRQEFTISPPPPPPIRSFNKFNTRSFRRFNTRHSTFERRNHTNLPRIKAWKCPKRELYVILLLNC